MKKVFSIFAISAMLVACGGQTSQTSEEATTDSTAVEEVAVDSTTIGTTSDLEDAAEVEVTEEAPAVVE